jgi:hypothetical protein
MTMPTKQAPAWPVRGTPGGWRDIWDDPDAVAAAQDQAARGAAVTERFAEEWRAASAARAARPAVGANPRPPEE